MIGIIPFSAEASLKDLDSLNWICRIQALEPTKELIIARYKEAVDPHPVCGWLAMYCELKRLKLFP